MSYQQKTLLVKRFRQNSTKSELILWQHLRRKRFHNLKFRRQFVVLGYILDFYCYKYKLAIEIDGEIHRRQKGVDKKRQKIIELIGIRFFRITSQEVEDNIDKVLDKLNTYLQNLPLSTKVERGRGGEEGWE